MCNTDPKKGKEKVNEESVAKLKMMENQNNEKKRKAIVMEKSHVETQSSKTPQNAAAAAAEEESEDSSNEISPFLLFGFIIDPRRDMQTAYSCTFCSRKFTTPQALGGHQNSHKSEKRLKRRIQAFNRAWMNFSSGDQGITLNTIAPFNGGCGYQCYGFNNMIHHAGSSSNFYAGNLFGALPKIGKVNVADQGIVSQKVTMTHIEIGSVSNQGGAAGNEVDQEDKETQEEEASKIDLTLKL